MLFAGSQGAIERVVGLGGFMPAEIGLHRVVLDARPFFGALPFFQHSSGGAEQGVADGVNEYVGVAMADESEVIKSIACAASSTITKLWSASLSMSIITTSARSLSIETKVCSSIVLYNYIVIN